MGSANTGGILNTVLTYGAQVIAGLKTFSSPVSAPNGGLGQLVTFEQVIGLGQTRSVTGKFVDTIYTNTGIKPIKIYIICTMQGAVAAVMTIGGITMHGSSAFGSGGLSVISEIILPGETYSLSSALVGGVNAWVEIK